MLLIPIQFLINSLNLSIIFAVSLKPGRSRGFEPYAGRGERPGRIERTPAQRSDPARSEAGRGREAGRGGSEKGGGAGRYYSLIFLYLTFHFSMIVNSFN